MKHRQVIRVGAEDIPFRVVQSRGRSIGLRFSVREPVLEIRTPSGRFGAAEQLAIDQNRPWILKHYAHKRVLWAKRASCIQELEQGRGLYLGQPIEVRTSAGQQTTVKVDQAAGILHLTLDSHWQELQPAEALYHGLRTLAKHELKRLVHIQAQRTQLHLNQIRVKDVTTRWGSCSDKRNVNLNWHLILIPRPLIDYLIIHELMHLHEMNHSPRFWNWVAKYYPDYRQAEQELTDHEWLIGIFDQWIGGEN